MDTTSLGLNNRLYRISLKGVEGFSMRDLANFLCLMRMNLPNGSRRRTWFTFAVPLGSFYGNLPKGSRRDVPTREIGIAIVKCEESP